MDENTQDENQDLKELQEVAGVSVWSQNQETIEKQALEHYKELTLNKNRDRNNDDQLEEGEISDHSEIKCKNKQVTQKPLLDIDQYIRNQTVLKSLQCSKKRLDECSTTKRSKSVAERISENQKNKLKSRQKTKKQVSGGSLQSHDKDVKNAVRKDKQYHETGDAEESGSEYVPSEGELDDYCNVVTNKKSNKKQIKKSNTEKIVVEKVRDDGDINVYKCRIERLNELKVQKISSKDQNEESEEDDDDILPDKVLESGLKVPGKIWNRLYRYQRVGVKWMSELNEQRVGGLLGDEMGLGKTVQVIAFLAALDNTKTVSTFGKYKGLGPTLIICPATVLHQWVRHFHEWWPTLRVAVLHQSGTFHGQMIKLIKEMNKSNGVLLTTYQGVLRHKGNLVELQWHYVILDEGHKIRNPNAKVTVAVKQFKTPHRLVLTGSPMQNNLTELWSLFDFITPGKLGSQQVFLEHFATPIIQGGYTNASPMQEATALSIATALKDAITPYMLRRAKLDLSANIDLPNKNEQVLFCGLTREQYDLYKGYLMAEHVGSILGRDKSSRCSENMMRAKILMALTILRKICNHPDLYLGEIDTESGENANVEVEEKYGYFKRAGKMVVVANLLRIWKRQGHRVLLFNQTRGMIEIFEEFLRQCEYKYLKMDGTTSIGSRQPLIDKFNNDPSYFVFLLTTRVGGLGVNLTGANRVIIYDPDWNPATDTQARERAWRIGQEKNVTVYRLLSAGTIEEKIYQRQVWKQLLSNKILVDPRQRRFFRTSDLHDLFSIQDRHSDGNIETANIFKNSQVELMTENSRTSTFTKDKIEEMKLLAQKLSKKITSSQTITKSNDEKPIHTESLNDPNEIWDPDTVRFKKRRKIRIPVEGQEMNLIDNSITNLSFTAALNVIDEQIIQNNSENSVVKVSNTIDKQSNAIEEKCIKIEEQSVEIKEEQSVEIKEEHLPSNTLCNENVNSVDEVFDQKNLNEYDGKKRKIKYEDKDYKHRKRKRDHKIDSTGCIDGEKVENLVKREKLKTDAGEYTEKKIDEKQDEYVLSKLLSKGVTALKHDAIIQSGYEDKNSIRVRTEAQRRTEIALKALRKSRLRNWRW